MELSESINQILAQYERHGWKLRRALLTTASLQKIEGQRELLAGAEIAAADIDALWFARPSHGGREAWELRLVAEQPYALFEAFESDETEAEREDARLEMENRMREYAAR